MTVLYSTSGCEFKIMKVLKTDGLRLNSDRKEQILSSFNSICRLVEYREALIHVLEVSVGAPICSVPQGNNNFYNKAALTPQE